MPFRIICANDSEVVRQGIEQVCSLNGIVADQFVGDYSELQRALSQDHFDVLICESRLHNVEMLEPLVEIRGELRDLRIIMYTHVANPTLVAQCVAYHFYDFVLQCGEANKLIKSLRTLGSGTPNRESVLERFRVFMTQSEWAIPTIAESLTRREFQILVHLGLGLCNKEIMGSLGISLETVKEHVQNVLRKLKVNDRTAAAVWALRNRMPTITFLPEDFR